MESKCLRRNLILISTICLLEFITSIASTTCPEGQYYFENSTKEENSTTVGDGNNCHYCKHAISKCISCFFNHSKVVCHNCTDGLTLSVGGDLCVESGIPAFGVVLIVLTIIILVVGASTFVYFYRKNHGKSIPRPNTFPDPDGLSKGERSGKVKNKYIRDPTNVVARIEPAYGTQAEERTSGSSMNWKKFGEPRKSMGKTAKVEDANVENKKVRVRKAEVIVQPDGQDEESHQYENFGVKSGTKIHSQYPKGNNDDVYQNA